MERRVGRLEDASKSALLCKLATEVAEAAGLDPALVLAEAEAVLTSAKEQTPP
jgi:hypothetical protein